MLADRVARAVRDWAASLSRPLPKAALQKLEDSVAIEARRAIDDELLEVLELLCLPCQQKVLEPRQTGESERAMARRVLELHHKLHGRPSP